MTLARSQCIAAEFCVKSNEELQQAFSTAASNKANDIVKIAANATNIGDFQLLPETGFSLQVIGGWDEDCVQRIARLQQPADTINEDLPASYFEPHLSTSGPQRPASAESELSQTQALLSGAAFIDGAQASITGVPAYVWRHGCGPTAVGMLAGYYALQGYTDLLDGSAATQTNAVQQMIASQNSSSDPGNYEDYCLPLDDNSTGLLADKSQKAASARHSDNSIADFMNTSQSAEGLMYGWSYSDDIIPAFTQYAAHRSAGYTVTGTTYYMKSNFTWSVLTNEIDNNRPMAFLVDSDGDGDTDHFIAVIGYRDSPTQQYACYDTWDQSVHWYNFRSMSSAYTYGVWAGMAFSISGVNLELAGRLIWQKQNNGKVAWWKVATIGKLFNTQQDSGWGYVSDSLTLNSAWKLGGSAIIDSNTSLIWQKQTKGKVAYWKLDTDYKLQDETQDSGWSYISDTLTLNSAWELSGITQINSENYLLWQKRNTGEVAWWRLNTYGKLANNTQNDGWGYVSDELSLNSTWRLAGITDINGYTNLIWQQQSNGKVAYWKLASNTCTLLNSTQGDGWDYISDSITLNSHWRLASITSIESQIYLLWQKASNGKVAYWKLSTNGKLPNETQDDGWGFVADSLTLNSAWSLGGVMKIDSLPVLFWHKSSNGRVAYWKLTSSCKLQDNTQDSGWGFVSDSLYLNSNWRLADVMQ